MKRIPPPPAPKPLKWYNPSDVSKYIRTRHNFDVTRKTVYNWMKIGVRGEKLSATRRGIRLMISDAAIDKFVRHILSTSPRY